MICEIDKTDETKNDQLFSKVAELIELARKKVATTVNLTMVHTYFEIGRMIVEDEQQGKERAGYGKTVLKDLSIRLTGKFGRGFSVDNLQNMRRFYLTYSIYETSSRKLQNIELQRLALSRNKDEVMKLANEGQTIIKPEDILKNPLSLEFLGLAEKVSYSETDMEQAIISKLQQFILELGKGFLFEARQKRFTFDEKHYFVDLVFYNRLLQCFVLIDLKTDELVHQDLGQMQMYVNYYDRIEKLEYEKPTIGILLCKRRNKAMVELTLPKDANIYASEYSLYLPDKKLLQQKLADWLMEYENNVG